MTHYNRNFIYTCPSKVFEDNSLSLNELKIYMMIRSFMDTTGSAYPSNNWIADKLKISRRKTIDNINKLINKGYLERILINEKRYLRIPVAPIIEQIDESLLVTLESPPSDARVTPPSDFKVTQLYQNTITSKIIKKEKDKEINKEKEKEKWKVNPVTYEESTFDTSYKKKQEIEITSNTTRFEEFWSIYPKQKNKHRARMLWSHEQCDKNADEIISKLRTQVDNDMDWRKGYAPSACNYITEKRWEDEVTLEKINQKKNTDLNHDDMSWANQKPYFS